jgi:hypothetical protein
VRLDRSLFSHIVLNLCVDAGFGLVVYPFSNKKLVLIVVEIGALTLTQIVNPVAFKMITVSLSENTIAVSLCLVPLSLINVFTGVNHTTFALGHAINPVAIVAILIFVKEGTTAMLLVLEPIASVLTTELLILNTPISSLAVALVNRPHAFILVSVLVILDTEALLAVITPVTNVTGGMFPLFSLDRTILLLFLF